MSVTDFNKVYVLSFLKKLTFSADTAVDRRIDFLTNGTSQLDNFLLHVRFCGTEFAKQCKNITT